MSCHSLSSPGVQLPAGPERPRPHPRGHQSGDQSSGRCTLWEAEAWQRPERVLLGEELALSQHHQRRDRPHHRLPLQGVWQVGGMDQGPNLSLRWMIPLWGAGQDGLRFLQLEIEPGLSKFSLIPSTGSAWYLRVGGLCP